MIGSSGGSGTSSGSVSPSSVGGSSRRSSSSAEKPVRPRSKSMPCSCGQLQGQLVVVPLRQRGGLVVGDAVGLGLGRAQADGDVDGDRLQPQLQGGLVAGVADDDDALLVHDDGLAEAELLDRGGDGVHGGVVEAGVVLVRADAGDRSHFDVHACSSVGGPARSRPRDGGPPAHKAAAGTRRKNRAKTEVSTGGPDGPGVSVLTLTGTGHAASLAVRRFSRRCGGKNASRKYSAARS